MSDVRIQTCANVWDTQGKNNRKVKIKSYNTCALI